MSIAAHVTLTLSLIATAAMPASIKPRSLQVTEGSEQRCDGASPQAAVLGCYLALAARSQTAVRRTFEQSLQTAEAHDEATSAYARHHASDSSSFEQLKASQAAWLKYSASQCAFERASSFGGSGTDILEAECRYRINAARLRELTTATALFNR